MNPFISCRLDSEGGAGTLPTAPKLCRRWGENGWEKREEKEVMEHLLQLFHPLIKHSHSVFVALSCGCPRVLSSLSNSSLMSTTLLHVTCRRNKKQCFGHAKKITSVWEMTQIFLMQLCRGQPCSQDQTRIELPTEW